MRRYKMTPIGRIYIFLHYERPFFLCFFREQCKFNLYYVILIYESTLHRHIGNIYIYIHMRV